MGYETQNMILNMENSFFFVFLIIFITCFLVKMRPSMEHKENLIAKMVIKLYGKIVFNLSIRFLIEGFLDFSLISLVSLYKKDLSQTGETIGFVISFVSLVILIIFPFAAHIFIEKNFHKFKNENFQHKYGSLF
jgi:hypothetical protein